MTTDGDERLAALEEAVTVLEGSPSRLERAEALADLGAAWRRGGRRADARPPLREALELARRCGAAGLARRAYDELAATGERVRRYTPIGVESLTPSERRVAELAAGGMTNRQIAQTLFVTVKTVETHLAAAYDKLGIRSRRELPRRWRWGGRESNPHVLLGQSLLRRPRLPFRHRPGDRLSLRGARRARAARRRAPAARRAAPRQPVARRGSSRSSSPARAQSSAPAATSHGLTPRSQ